MKLYRNIKNQMQGKTVQLWQAPQQAGLTLQMVFDIPTLWVRQKCRPDGFKALVRMSSTTHLWFFYSRIDIFSLRRIHDINEL